MSAQPRATPGPLSGLSVKLIATIVIVILAVGVLLFLPSIATYRAGWVDTRLRIGVVAGRVLDAVPDIMAVPGGLTDRLLASVGAHAIVYRRGGQSQLIELSDRPEMATMVVADLRDRNLVSDILGALETLFVGGSRTLRIVGDSEGTENAVVEILMPERPLRDDMLVYTGTVAIVAAAITAITSAVLFILLSRILIRPIRRLSANMMAFRQAPENATLILTPRGRNDELGVLEAELAAMEADIFSMLRQRQHLADLGLAVAKINHDLRNTLTSAQLLSDQVADLDDPKVQRLAPRLVTTLGKAIGFAQAVLDYGRENAVPPELATVAIRALIDDAAIEAGLHGHPQISFRNDVPADLLVRVDPGQIGRIFTNLIRNAWEALEAQASPPQTPTIVSGFGAEPDALVFSISDNGPGLPPRARDNLFTAFEGSARSGGTGLGLAIARELAEAHGGRLAYVPLEPGTRFELRLPLSSRIG